MREEGRGLVRWGSIVESLKGQGAGRKRKSSQYEHGSGVGQWTGLPMCPSHGAFPAIFTGSALQFLGLPATDRQSERRSREPGTGWVPAGGPTGGTCVAHHLHFSIGREYLANQVGHFISTLVPHLGTGACCEELKQEQNQQSNGSSSGYCPHYPAVMRQTQAGAARSPQPSTKAHRRCRLNPRAKCGKWDSKRLAKILFRLGLKTALPRSWHDEELGRLQSWSLG